MSRDQRVLVLIILCYNLQMGEISLDMIWKRLEEVQAEQAAMHTEIKAARTDLTVTNEKIGGIATTLVGIQRDIRSLQATVTTLGVAVDDHTHRLDHMGVRLDHIEKHLGIGGTPPN
jgi:hypothetical protein